MALERSRSCCVDRNSRVNDNPRDKLFAAVLGAQP
jgi:hypothetical protein